MDDDLIPISAIQHAVYCLRQAALIHIERTWEENRFTAEGRVLHATTDKLGSRYSRGVRRVAAMPLASHRLGLVGIADVVEFHRSDDIETPYPVEFKRGKPKAHRADEAQLCAPGPVSRGHDREASARGRAVLRRDSPASRGALRRRFAASDRERRRGG